MGGHSGTTAASNIPGDNPVYGVDEKSIIPISVPHGINARLPVRSTTSHTPSLSSSTSETGTQHDLQNPLYGSLECDNEYAIPGPVYATVDTVNEGQYHY